MSDETPSRLRREEPRHSPRARSARQSSRGVRPAGTRSRKRTLGAVVLLVATLLLVVLPAYAAWQLLIAPDVPDVTPGVPVQVEVPAGVGTAEIARVLVEAGVVKNAAMFRLRARLDEIDGKLRPGVYELTTTMAYEEVVERLLAGPPVEYTTVTIPEGFTVEQIAVRFDEECGIPAAEITALALGQASVFAEGHPYLVDVYNESLEGYLFPKTYRVVDGSDAADVIEMMLDQFDVELAAVDLTYATGRGLSLNEFVTLASMVEREARVADERPIVASVIYNRLERGMRLEIDATIEYIIKENRPRLLNRDLEIDSPFNTYKNAGLPPGPIASPGLASLQATAAPADTKFIYYVLTGADGSHTFTETYEEFLIAKEKSREVTP